MEGVQPKVVHGTAGPIRLCLICGCLRPASVPPLVFKLQETSVLEEEHGLVELVIGHIADSLRCRALRLRK